MNTKQTTKTLAAALIALGTVLPAAAPAQVKTVDKLKYPALPAFDVPQPKRVVLDNGMVVMLVEDHELPLIDAIAMVRTGARLEPAEKVGMAALTGTVLRTGGTTNMNGDNLDDFLEGRAASVETLIGAEQGRASMSCLKKDFPDVIKIFADVLRRPAFDPEKLEVARTQVVSAISRQNDDPFGIMFREFDEIIYGETSPYARTETYASVGSVTREDLVNWHKEYFHPDRIILGLVGDFSTDEVLAQVKAAFGDWAKGPAPRKIEAAYNKTADKKVHYVEKSDMTQSDIIMGHLGIERNNPDYYAVEVLNEAFSGGFAARLFTNVRSKKGLAYAVQGGVGSNWDYPGLFTLWMTTKVETTAAGIDALLEEARQVTATPLTQDEIDRAKSAILSSFVFNSDSRRKILNQQLTYEYYGYPLDWLTRYRQGIEKVTLAQAQQAAAKYIHPDQFTMLVVGPKEKQDRPLSEFGTVVARDIKIPEPETAKVAGTEESRKKGAALIARAVDAMGGASKVDAIESLEFKGMSVASTPNGDMEIKTVLVVEYPDSLRQDLTLPFGVMSQVFTSSDAFMSTPQGVRDMPDSQRIQMKRTLRRLPLTLVRLRNEPYFSAVAVGPMTVEGGAAEGVQVEMEGDVLKLAIDGATGRIVQMSFQGQDLSGAPGEITQTYSDFRQAAGLTLAFATRQTMSGKPVVSSQTESVSVNQPVAEGTFGRPEAMTAKGAGK